MPEFGILMSSYNKSPWIGKAIESVLMQTEEDWELVVVEDASTDDSVEVIERYLKDPRVRLVKHETNLGMGTASRTAVEHLTAPIIGMLDADDALRSDAIAIMREEYRRHPDYGMIYSMRYRCDKNLVPGKDKWQSMKIPRGLSMVDIWRMGGIRDEHRNIQECTVGPFRTFTRKAYDKTEGFGDWRNSQDFDIVLKLEEVTDLLFVAERLYYHRILERSMSADRGGPDFMPQIAEATRKRREKQG